MTPDKSSPTGFGFFQIYPVGLVYFMLKVELSPRGYN